MNVFPYTDLQTGFSNNLSKCTFSELFIDETNKQYYKSCDFIEPCVGMGMVDGKEYKTSIKVSKNIIEEMKNIYFIKNNKCVIK